MKPLPEIVESDLKAARQFLTSVREEERGSRLPRPSSMKGVVPLRLGITRARMRLAAKSGT